MAIDPKLLEIRACPVCRQPVKITPAGDGLRCHACRRVYPIIDDIPVMLVERATTDPE